MSEGGESVRGVVLAHGGMAEGLVDAVRKISGESEALTGMSNEGLGPDDLFRRLAELTEPGPTVIFTDLHTGSCALAARAVCADPERRAVVFGANLPMLLDFVFHRDLPLDELVPRILSRGRDGIQALIPQREHGDPAV